MSDKKRTLSGDEATKAVLRGDIPAGPPAAGSAGVPWGGAGATDAWSDDKSEYSNNSKPTTPSPK